MDNHNTEIIAEGDSADFVLILVLMDNHNTLKGYIDGKEVVS